MRRARASRADEAGDRRGGLGDLGVRRLAAAGEGVGDAMREVLVEQLDGDRLERLGHGRDLVEDVDAVLVLVDHPLQAAHLAFDTTQPLVDRFLVVGVAGHAITLYPTWVLAKAVAGNATDGTTSVAEGRCGIVADPLPHRDRALDLGACDERAFVELLGVEADGADVVATAGRLVALHQVSQWWAALAGDADRDAVEREPDGFF